MTSGQLQHEHTSGMSRGLTLLFAVAGGAAVGNLYWAGPLLSDIGESLDVSDGQAGLLVTVTQIGYAVGIFLVVPLGDTVNRRRLIPSIMFCSAVALVACAAAPSFAVLLVALAALGLTTVSAQLLTPLAGDLARDEQRGRVLGTVVSGLIIGILLSRTISGFVADAFGWRAIYMAAAVLMTLLAVILIVVLPTTPERPAIGYRRLLLSVFGAVRQHKSVRVTMILGMAAFAVFTMFWTGLTFLLSSPPFSYSVNQIGLVGLVGLAGALAARRAGALYDRGLSVPATGIALTLTLVALAVAGIGAQSIFVIIGSVLLLDVAVQMVNILNQTRILSIDPQARSRLNTAFVTVNFVGGAFGSALAGILWQIGGWSALVWGAAAIIAAASAVWLAYRGLLGGEIESSRSDR
ncbi:MFS transporter [Williamsia muralis]|uniref:MFS transporter n=2 Tax=Williamsia marianensis TaxID=85044 RepID=A0A2G3PMX9_WILMA|nr:MFS transporter [Williamsia marianensis]